MSRQLCLPSIALFFPNSLDAFFFNLNTIVSAQYTHNIAELLKGRINVYFLAKLKFNSFCCGLY